MFLAALFAVATSDLRLELVRESLTGTHSRYRVYEQGLPTDEYVTTRSPRRVSGHPQPSAGSIASPAGVEGMRVSRGQRIQRRIVAESPFEPYAYDYDVATGRLIRRTPLFFRAKAARVFDPNPVASLNAPELQDLNDQSGHIPAAAYRDVELPDTAVHGPWVDLVDRQLPVVPPPEGPLVFDRTADGFEDVSAYFHIDRNQRWVQSLGYTGTRAIAPYAVSVDAHAATGVDNSFFIPSSTQAGRGALYFGEGGTDDAEDADIIIHEYTHALIEWISPGTFGGGFGSESRALAEGLGDYWAFSAHSDVRRASGRDPYCLADWDARCWLDASSEQCGYPANSDCLRRVDGDLTMADYDPGDASGTEHHNGAIWSSALREIREQLPRNVADTIVLESLFGAPPRPNFAVMANRLLEADQLLYQGAHQGVICAAMGARGILAQCGQPMRGELTHLQSRDRHVLIPDNRDEGVTSTLRIDDPRTIERVYVRVDISHSARGDLRIELIAPDGTVVLLQPISSSRTPDIHVTYGLTAAPAESLDILRGRSAAGTWMLRIADVQPLDSGKLVSWGLDIQFAGDEPQTVRPRGVLAQMIPVVAHLYGQAGAYVSDVRIANRGAEAQTVTLIFTRSTKDGLTEFLATRVFVGAGQTLSLDDVVERTFHTAGSGSLEILGDVHVMSRTYLAAPGGTLGQDVPAVAETTTLGETPLVVAPFHEAGTRVNVGLTEVAGGRGVVNVAGRDIVIEPFSHVQLPSPGSMEIVRVVSGNARVAAYVSQLRNDDAMFIPARRAEPHSGIAPVITGQGSEPPQWRSDFWAVGDAGDVVAVELTGGGSVTTQTNVWLEDVIARLFHRTLTYGAMRATTFTRGFTATRIVHGNTMQYVPFSRTLIGDQAVLFVENDSAYRTNLGIVAMGPAEADVIVYDAAGLEVERHRLATLGGFVQVAVGQIVNGGRAEFRFRGEGRAYASLIDRRTGDATFVAAQ